MSFPSTNAESDWLRSTMELSDPPIRWPHNTARSDSHHLVFVTHCRICLLGNCVIDTSKVGVVRPIRLYDYVAANNEVIKYKCSVHRTIGCYCKLIESIPIYCFILFISLQ